ncbi:MAG TPA: glycoside hydrolase family 43 protein [Candidatus Limnocylindrales bacterium]|nr:glycoside hydrolase family 43 protein [Candidatus Limnocylindrales bacterium]
MLEPRLRGRLRPATPATFVNPVYPGYFADPYVVRHGDTYWAYGTGPSSDHDSRVFEILRSDDLVHWEPVGRALERLDIPGATTYWAPEVVADRGVLFLYYSVGDEDRGHVIRVATADRPEGPFLDSGQVLTPDEPFAIDAHPFRDVDGEWYLYYARDLLTGDRVGTSLAVDRLVDMTALAGDPRAVLTPTADWQLFKRARPMYGSVYDWHTLEGPFVVRRNGRYYCLYSGGAWTGAGYGVSWAVADDPLGPFSELRSDRATLLRSVPGLAGPGHNSIVTGPDGEDYLVYHAWDSGHTGRRMCIDRVDWTADGPRTLGPTARPQPVPRAA